VAVSCKQLTGGIKFNGTLRLTKLLFLLKSS